MNGIERMRQLRAALMDFAANVPDEKAYRYPSLFAEWKTGTAYTMNDRIQYCGKLWKCLQAHTSQSDWTPDSTAALWVAIDVSHAGTINDPIPAVRGMEYTYGSYYYDKEDKNIYLCARTGAVNGETIILQYLPHELIGIYFEKVN